jgi:prepilin peptidase CpaA
LGIEARFICILEIMSEGLLFDLFLILFIVFSMGFDAREKRIPNWLVFPGMAGGILLNASKGNPYLIHSLLGLGLASGILILPFALGWMGGGDVKFLGALGAILGVTWVPHLFFYSALLGGLLALVSIVHRGMNLSAFQESWWDFKLLITSRGAVLPERVSDRVLKGAHTIPYGIAIGLGTLVAFYVDPRGQWSGF